MPLSSGPESFGKFNVLAMIAKLIDVGAPILTGEGVPASGTSGKFADTSQGAVYIDVSVGALYMNHGSLGSPIWVLVGTAGGFNTIGKSSFTIIRGHFNAAVHDTSVGIHPFLDGSGSPIPVFNRSHVLFAWIDVQTALAGGGASVAIGSTLEPTDIQSSTVITGVPWTVGDHPVSGPNDWNTPASFTRFQSDANFAYTILDAPLTGGHFDVFCYYTQYEEI